VIRSAILKRIRQALDSPPQVLSEDFSISTADVDEFIQLDIKYVGGDQFFTAMIPKEKSTKTTTTGPTSLLVTNYSTTDYDFQIECEFNPGDVSHRELIKVWGVGLLVATISNWSSRLAEDLADSPLARSVEQIEERIRELEESLAKAPDALPTDDEVAKLKNFLEEVRTELAARISELEGDAAVKEKRLADLEEQFNAMRERVGSMTVKAFVRLIAGRVYRFGSDPKTGRLIENAKKLAGLLGSGNDS